MDFGPPLFGRCDSFCVWIVETQKPIGPWSSYFFSRTSCARGLTPFLNGFFGLDTFSTAGFFSAVYVHLEITTTAFFPSIICQLEQTGLIATFVDTTFFPSLVRRRSDSQPVASQNFSRICWCFFYCSFNSPPFPQFPCKRELWQNPRSACISVISPSFCSKFFSRHRSIFFSSFAPPMGRYFFHKKAPPPLLRAAGPLF